MSVALYFLGFVVFFTGVVWAAVVAGVPQTYILVGSLLLIGAGVLTTFHGIRPKDRPPL